MRTGTESEDGICYTDHPNTVRQHRLQLDTKLVRDVADDFVHLQSLTRTPGHWHHDAADYGSDAVGQLAVLGRVGVPALPPIAGVLQHHDVQQQRDSQILEIIASLWMAIEAR